MRHLSVKLDSPVEFINVEPLNPLISKCQIKVCYVGEEPNRNGSIITKETAKAMASSLPGCPIVGFYNEQIEDFEEHNRIIEISNGKFEIKDTTKPYGFVDLNAKPYFQKFLDDNEIEREYLMVEGYLWTEQYPECKRILTRGNNQSMELEENYLHGNWSEDENGYPEIANGLREDMELELENMKDQYEEQRRVETDKIRAKYQKRGSYCRA